MKIDIWAASATCATIEELKARYRQIVETAQTELTGVERQITRISLARVALFLIGTAVAIAVGMEAHWSAAAGTVIATMVPFALLMKRHNRLFGRKAYLETLIEINRQELRAADYDYACFPNGAEFSNPAHNYSYDLDLFGDRSLYQYINRTCTPMGHNQLGSWLANHPSVNNRNEGAPAESVKQLIEARQAAIRELASKLAFRQHFRITGLLHRGVAADEGELSAWSRSESLFSRYAWLRALPFCVGGINLICLGLTLTGAMTGTLWGSIWMLLATASFGFTHRISRIQTVYGKKLQILKTYASLLHEIEQEPFEAELLRSYQTDITHQQRNASEVIGQLEQLMEALDRRNNVFMLAILNGCFFWELRQMMRIEQWKEQHAAQLPSWLNVLGKMDALCSLATFAYNHPDYCWPDIATHCTLKAEAMGHPLMHCDECVTNNFTMDTRPAFIIITGANMVGKSTYLRTLGINFVLACIGMPVYADSLTIYPSQLLTSLRTTDSLSDHESYFFAELKRLKLIIDRLKAGEELFIILDEILKGTNSVDKQKGSSALIKQLLNLRANGIIATHDLLLGKLAEEFPNAIQNFRFEADIKNDELTFSYQLRPGIAENMNACFLMKKMGIMNAE